MRYFSTDNKYLAPAFDSKEDEKLGWLKEAVEEGESYLKSQRSWRDIDKSIDILSGFGMDNVPKGMSRIHINMVKRDMREAAATLANMRPLWGYKTDNNEYQQLTMILNKMLMAWYLGTFADRSIRDALLWAGGPGTGWVSPHWEKDYWVRGRGDIVLGTYGPRDILPVQIGKDHDIQKAYAVTIHDEVPFARACAQHPTQIDKLVPDRSTPTWMRKGIRRVQKYLSPALQRFGPGQGKDSEESEFPTVDIYRTYILDTSYNDTGKDILMGSPGTNWSYNVPSIKSEIDTGVRDSAGHDLVRRATAEDAMLFPLRRLTKWTNQGILYDNTSTYWHGKVPAVKFTVDDMPWNFLGTGMTHDGDSIQESNTRLLRAIDDAAQARLDPAVIYDENLVSAGLMDRFNPRKAGQRIKGNLQMGDVMKTVIDSRYYDVPEWIANFIDKNYERLHYVLGIRDIQAIAKARQVPAGDSLEKLMELAGPLVQDMSRNMERSMRDIGEQWKGLAMQFYDVKRRVQILGKDGVVEEDFDYDPGTMIPSHLPDELELIRQKQMSPDHPSRASIVTRAKAHLDSCYFHVTPNSLHQITQLTKRLMLLQLWRGGFPIDPWTVAEGMDIENFGTPAAAAKIMGAETAPLDVMGKWILWTELKAKLGEAAGGGQRGRKPSGQVPPTQQSKDSGTRGTIRESPR